MLRNFFKKDGKKPTDESEEVEVVEEEKEEETTDNPAKITPESKACKTLADAVLEDIGISTETGHFDSEGDYELDPGIVLFDKYEMNLTLFPNYVCFANVEGKVELNLDNLRLINQFNKKSGYLVATYDEDDEQLSFRMTCHEHDKVTDNLNIFFKELVDNEIVVNLLKAIIS